MEKYSGVKFFCRKFSDDFPKNRQMEILNHWAWVFSQIGLTPVHAEGAYGNMSCRSGGGTFVITKTGMKPQKEFEIDNFSLVEPFDEENGEFCFSGKNQPSSECFLHDSIYRKYDAVKAVLHGHSAVMNEWADILGIPTTAHFYDYGTSELADSALEIVSMENRIIILKDHGFVAVGSSIGEAGRLVLGKYRELLSFLERQEETLFSQ